MSGFSFDLGALEGILGSPAAQVKLAVYVRPDLLDIAKTNCSSLYPGWPRRNPASGTVNGDTGVFMRGDRSKAVRRAPGQFRDTLRLEISPTGDLEFSSPATSDRGGFAYGQALIDGRGPFKGRYKLLPPEYYT